MMSESEPIKGARLALHNEIGLVPTKGIESHGQQVANKESTNKRRLRNQKHPEKALSKTKRSRNEDLTDSEPQDYIECAFDTYVADIGILACSESQYCVENAKSSLGGMCVDTAHTRELLNPGYLHHNLYLCPLL